MDIKFVLLVIGIFIFTLGYVNQNKYNCNIIPSLDRLQEQNLRNLFNRDSSFINYNRDLNLLEETSEQDMINNTGTRPLPIIVQSGDYINQIDSQSREYRTRSGIYGGR
tara:strand:+ start:2202 stop:2528 length:327 start_codon:yes stop_codon:yes gene_type:complete